MSLSREKDAYLYWRYRFTCWYAAYRWQIGLYRASAMAAQCEGGTEHGNGILEEANEAIIQFPNSGGDVLLRQFPVHL